MVTADVEHSTQLRAIGLKVFEFMRKPVQPERVARHRRTRHEQGDQARGLIALTVPVVGRGLLPSKSVSSGMAWDQHRAFHPYDQLAISLPAPGPRPKPWPENPEAKKQALHLGNRADHRHCIRRGINHAAPAFLHRACLKDRIGQLQGCSASSRIRLQGFGSRMRICSKGEISSSRQRRFRSGFVDEACAQASASRRCQSSFSDGRNWKNWRKLSGIRFGNREMIVGDGVAAIQPLAEGKAAAGAGDLQTRCRGARCASPN